MRHGHSAIVAMARLFALACPVCLLLFLLNGERITMSQTADDTGSAAFAGESIWPPPGERITCPVTRDTGISSVEGERDANNGASEMLKLKGQQEFVLFDIDPAPLRGRIVTGALLHLRSASKEEAPLGRVGVSNVAADWEEGTSRQYRTQVGSPCFNQAGFQKKNWAYPGSTVMDVVFGRGNTVWRFADCTPPDREGWQVCPVDPDVVAARVAGLSYGFCLYDEVGNVWSLKKGQFDFVYFPNRLFHSRETKGSSPWLEVWTAEGDARIPPPVDSITVGRGESRPGEVQVSWKTPETAGGNRVLGFIGRYGKGGTETPVPRYLLPMAGKPGQKVTMYLDGMGLKPGEAVDLTIRAVDAAGRLGKPLKRRITVPPLGATPSMPGSDPAPFRPGAILPSVGGLKVAVIDPLDKIDPVSGAMIPHHENGYKSGNHLFSAENKVVRLQSARNETIAFQIALEGGARDATIACTFPGNRGIKPRIYEFAYVSVSDRRNKAGSVLPDPLVPYSGSFSIPSTAGGVHIREQQNHSLLCELYVPHDVPAGRKKGKLTIGVGAEKLDIDVDLTVWNFTLPDKLSFVPEMNAYGGYLPRKGYEPYYGYYRLAHEHRTCLNTLLYGWNGIPDFAPPWQGRGFEWAEWDSEAAPLLDGSLFKDLPRSGEPVDVFYLPFSENWPVSLPAHYSGSYWADEAFASPYGKELGQAFRAFAAHIQQKEWSGTRFQFYLNDKVYYRKNFKRSVAPWIFDEPMNTQDFWALRWYGLIWQAAVRPVDSRRQMWFRGDVSYSEFARNMLWGVVDIEYTGGTNAHKTRMKHDEWRQSGSGHSAEYGSPNRIEEANTQPALWCILAWSRGSIGVLPWQTLGRAASWQKADQLALFYPHAEGPVPSVRLKSFTRGQQDVEYLTLFQDVFGVPHHVVAGWLGKVIDEGAVSKSSEGDAGTLNFKRGTAVDLWKLRYRIGSALSEKAPEYRRVVYSPAKREFEPKRLPDIGYVRPAPAIERLKPAFDGF